MVALASLLARGGLCHDLSSLESRQYVKACSVGAEVQKIENGVAFDAEATAVVVRNSKIVFTPDGPDMQYSTGFCCSQGNCPHMEDRVVHVDISLEAAVQPCSRAFFTAVLDGHAGIETVNHLADTLLPALLAHGGINNRLRTDTLAVLRATILGCEADVLSREFTSGSTVLAAIMIDDQLFVANVGDCRAVVCEKRDPTDHLPTSLSLPGPHAAGSSTIEAIALAAAAAAALRTYSECGSSCSGFGSGSQTPVRAESSGGDSTPNGSSAWAQQFQQREDTAAIVASLSASTSSPTASSLGSPPSSSSPCAGAPTPTAFSRLPSAAAHPSAAATLSAFASMRQTLHAATSLGRPRLLIPEAGAGLGPATPSPRSSSRDSGGAPQRPCRAGVSTLAVEGLQVRQLTNDHAIKGNMLEKARVQAMGVSVSGDGYVHLTVNGECNDSGVTRVLGRAHIKRAASNPSLALLYRRSQVQSLAGSAMEWDAEVEDVRATPTDPHQQQHPPELGSPLRFSPQPRLLEQLQVRCEGVEPAPAARTHSGRSVQSKELAQKADLVQASQLLLAAGLVHTSRLMELCSRIPSLPGSGSSQHSSRSELPRAESNGSCAGVPSADDSGWQTSTVAKEERVLLRCEAQERKQQQQQQQNSVQHGQEQEAFQHVQQQQRQQQQRQQQQRQQLLSDSQQETLVDSGVGCCVLIPDPELHTYTITRDSEFLVLACDGIWDVMTNGEVVRTVRRIIAGGGTASEAAAALAKRAVAAPESRDNCSVVVVCFSSRQLQSHSTRNSALRRGPSLAVPSAKLEMKSVAE